MKKLNPSQVKAFDTEYVDDCRWKMVKSYIDESFQDGSFSFLDIGGGNGTFTDRILTAYPSATATVFDSSELLISKNLKNVRKKCVCDTVENLHWHKDKYDLISVNWLLHHLVSDSYAQTRRNQVATLNSIREKLNPGGRVSVFENIYQGWFCKGIPGKLIFFLTSLKSISLLTRKLGANTAGVGVCFLSKDEWTSTIHKAKLTVLDYNEPDDWVWRIQWYWRVFLLVRNRSIGHFWLSAKDEKKSIRSL